MKNFIPHKNNPFVGQKILGALIIIFSSAAIVYFGSFYLKSHVEKANALQMEAKVEVVENAELSNSQNNSGKLSQNENIDLEKVEEEKLESAPISDSKQMAITIEEAKAPMLLERGKDPKKKLEEAKKFAKPQILEGKYIDVSLAHQNMVLFENGQYVDAYLISSGKKGMDTPIGTFKIENKVLRAWSKTYGLFMPNWMAIVPSGKFGIHELPEWPGGYKEGANHLGVAVSHGCVRLGIGDSKRVYDWADVGITVVIHK